MALHNYCDGVKRRDFVRIGGLGFAGITLSKYLQFSHAGEVARTAKAKAAIFVNLNGGPSHMDTFDLKPDAPSEYRGEFNPIETSVPGIQISEHLPNLAQAMRHYTILRGVSHNIAAHQLGTEYVNSGNRPLPALEFPGYGAVISKELECPQELPASISVPRSPQRAGYLGVKYASLNTGNTPTFGQPFSVRGIELKNGLTVADVERRSSLLKQFDTQLSSIERNSQLLEGLDRFSEQAYSMITSPMARDAFDISKEDPAFAKTYGETGFGQSCLLATRLVDAGVPFVCVTSGGWDTHRDNWNALKTRQLPPFDEGLAGLFNGLHERGLLESTIVLVSGEFGRTPKINTTRTGRDHYPRNMFMLMAGGGIQGGRVLGESDEKATLPVDKGFTPDDVAASFYSALGINPKKEYQTSTGRPVMIVRDGEVIPELFA